MKQYAPSKKEVFTQLPFCGKLITNEETGNSPSKNWNGIVPFAFLYFFLNNWFSLSTKHHPSLLNSRTTILKCISLMVMFLLLDFLMIEKNFVSSSSLKLVFSFDNCLDNYSQNYRRKNGDTWRWQRKVIFEPIHSVHCTFLQAIFFCHWFYDIMISFIILTN